MAWLKRSCVELSEVRSPSYGSKGLEGAGALGPAWRLMGLSNHLWLLLAIGLAHIGETISRVISPIISGYYVT